jgi:hypothetical protein
LIVGRGLVQRSGSSPSRNYEDFFLQILFVGEIRVLAESAPFPCGFRRFERASQMTGGGVVLLVRRVERGREGRRLQIGRRSSGEGEDWGGRGRGQVGS